MISYEISEDMKASPERIFPYLSSVELYPLWMGLKSAEVVTPEIQGLGMRWLSHLREGDFLIENHEFETNRMVGYKTIEGPFSWVGGFRLDPVGDKETRVTSYGQVNADGFPPSARKALRRSGSQGRSCGTDQTKGAGRDQSGLTQSS